MNNITSPYLTTQVSTQLQPALAGRYYFPEEGVMSSPFVLHYQLQVLTSKEAKHINTVQRVYPPVQHHGYAHEQTQYLNGQGGCRWERQGQYSELNHLAEQSCCRLMAEPGSWALTTTTSTLDHITSKVLGRSSSRAGDGISVSPTVRLCLRPWGLIAGNVKWEGLVMSSKKFQYCYWTIWWLK